MTLISPASAAAQSAAPPLSCMRCGVFRQACRIPQPPSGGFCPSRCRTVGCRGCQWASVELLNARGWCCRDERCQGGPRYAEAARVDDFSKRLHFVACRVAALSGVTARERPCVSGCGGRVRAGPSPRARARALMWAGERTFFTHAVTLVAAGLLPHLCLHGLHRPGHRVADSVDAVPRGELRFQGLAAAAQLGLWHRHRVSVLCAPACVARS